MKIDLGNTPVGTPPTLEQKNQILSAIGAAKASQGTKLFETDPDAGFTGTLSITFDNTMLTEEMLTALKAVNGGSATVTIQATARDHGVWNGGDVDAGTDIEISVNYPPDGKPGWVSAQFVWGSWQYYDTWSGGPLVEFVDGLITLSNDQNVGEFASLTVTRSNVVFSFPGFTGQFAIAPSGIFYCSNESLSTWIPVDSAWISTRLLTGSLTIAQVSDLQARLDAKQSIADMIDTPHPIRLRSSDNARWEVSISTLGILSATLKNRPLVANYFDTGVITSANADKLETLVAAIDSAVGIDSLVDLSIYKTGFNKIQSGVVRSLRGTSNAEVNGSPILGDCGLIMNGNSDSAKIMFPAALQNRSMLSLQQFSQSFQTPYSEQATAWLMFNNYAWNGYPGERLYFPNAATQALFSAMADGGVGERFATATGVNRAFPPQAFLSAYTYNGSAAAYTAGCLTFQARGVARTTGQTSALTSGVGSPAKGGGNNYSHGLLIGASGAGGGAWLAGETFARGSQHNCAMSMANWMVFNRVLTNEEVLALFSAVNLIHPYWIYVTEGDSIVQQTTPIFLTLPEMYGANMLQRNLAAGGKETPAIVANLGTSNGVTAAKLASDGGCPVIFDCFSTDDFTSGYNAAAQHADYRTIWAYVRAQNPDAVIIARTDTLERYIDSRKSEEQIATNNAGKVEFNALVRADLGTYFDVLVDSYAIAEAMKGPSYAHHGLDPAVISDGVHPSTTLSAAVGREIIRGIEAFGKVIR